MTWNTENHVRSERCMLNMGGMSFDTYDVNTFLKRFYSVFFDRIGTWWRRPERKKRRWIYCSIEGTFKNLIFVMFPEVIWKFSDRYISDYNCFLIGCCGKMHAGRRPGKENPPATIAPKIYSPISIDYPRQKARWFFWVCSFAQLGSGSCLVRTWFLRFGR